MVEWAREKVRSLMMRMKSAICMEGYSQARPTRMGHQTRRRRPESVNNPVVMRHPALSPQAHPKARRVAAIDRSVQHSFILEFDGVRQRVKTLKIMSQTSRRVVPLLEGLPPSSPSFSHWAKGHLARHRQGPRGTIPPHCATETMLLWRVQPLRLPSRRRVSCWPRPIRASVVGRQF